MRVVCVYKQSSASASPTLYPAMMEAPAKLKNTYWILRHGLSKPNVAGLIVSSLVS